MTITLELEPSFVLAEQIPFVAEDLRYGLEHYFIKERTVVDLAVDQVRRGASDPVLQELAALLRDEVDRVPEILEALDDLKRIYDPRQSARKWLYLQLKAAYVQRAQLRDPLGVAEQIHANFDYAPEASPFIRGTAEQAADEQSLVQAWARFLDDEHGALTRHTA